MSGLLQVTIEQGLIFSVLSIGVYITYKILDFPDLSVEGTFPLGAFVFAKFILLGASPGTATLMALLAGAAGGLVTYTLNIRFRIKAILELYSYQGFHYPVFSRKNLIPRKASV